MKDTPEQHFLFTEQDLAEWLNHPAWAWFKEICRAEGAVRGDEAMSLNPMTQAYEIAVAQGERNVYSRIVNGVVTPSGTVSFERFLVDWHQNITKDENTVIV